MHYKSDIQTNLQINIHESTTKSYIILICILIAMFAGSSHRLAGSPLNFRKVNINNGLSHNTINDIYKDNRGFIWLGTQLGLDRYDGINVKNYPCLQGYSVYSICETDSIHLWIGTDHGLIKMNRLNENIEPVELENRQFHTHYIFHVSANKLLVGTEQGLFLLNSNKKDKYTFDPNPVSGTNTITQILPCSQEGWYWLTSFDGLIRFYINTGESTIYKRDTNDNAYNAFSCLTGINDTLYIGTGSTGIVAFDCKTNRFSDFPYSGNGYITTISSAGENAIYAGTNGSGLLKIDTRTGDILSAVNHQDDEKSISSNAVYSFLQDDDILWIGTYMGGLNYNPTHGDIFSVYTLRNQFNSGNYNIRSFAIGRKGEKLIGTRDGFFYISEIKDIVKRFTSATSMLESDIIISITEYNDHYLIGTYGGGLYCFNPETLTLSWFIDNQHFKQNSFYGHVTDKEGNLWIASSNGVFVYNPANQNYSAYNNTNSGLANHAVFSITKDSKEQIWLGTNDGVYMYSPHTRVFRSDMFPKNILPYLKSIRCIYQDRIGNLWLCDDKEGIVKVDNNFSSFIHYTTDNLLPNNSVTSIIEDLQGGMWFASQRGLMHLDPQTSQTIFYSLFDGIPGYIFNPCVSIDAEGTLWWSNEQGLVYHNPSQINRKKKKTYYPALTSITIAGKTLQPGDKNSLYTASYLSELKTGAGNSIEFTFSALNYSIQNTDIYEYMLEGYDKSWNIIMSGNTAFYPNLSPGKYIFRVKSSSAPELITSLNLKVKRNISATVWGILIIFAGCILLALSYSRLLSKYRRININRQPKEDELQQKHQKYARSKVEETEAEAISRRLKEYMEKEKPYLNAGLKLHDVANAIQCSSVELSQVLNIYLNTNYTDFVNQYRVEDFIERVQSKSASRYTLTTLSEQSGFSSRTSFFRSFKKIKGKTPAEYLSDC